MGGVNLRSPMFASGSSLMRPSIRIPPRQTRWRDCWFERAICALLTCGKGLPFFPVFKHRQQVLNDIKKQLLLGRSQHLFVFFSISLVGFLYLNDIFPSLTIWVMSLPISYCITTVSLSYCIGLLTFCCQTTTHRSSYFNYITWISHCLCHSFQLVGHTILI